MPAKGPAEAIIELLEVMNELRSPGGCPWDRQQTPESLAPYILEEATEVIDAIESGNPEAVRDETGDLLLQVVFIARIFEERGLFSFSDVAEGITEKLVRRHPHVFGDSGRTLSHAELDRQWEAIKRRENAPAPETSHPLGHIPSHLPALQRAQKILDRAQKCGLALSGPAVAADTLSDRPTAAELGAALFGLVVRTRAAGFDAEQILRQHLRNLLAETA